MTLQSDSLVFDDYLKRVDARGNVILSLDDATIYADQLLFYVDDNMVMSSGEVLIQRSEDKLKSSSLIINLNEKKLHLSDLNVSITPYEKKGNIYVNIQSLIDSQKSKLGSYSRFTSCDAPNPHYYLSTWKFLYSPNKSIHLFGAQFHNKLSFFPFSIIPFPVPLIEWIPVPYYYYQLGERKMVLNFPTIGEKKSPGWGLFVQNKLDYRYKNNQESSFFLDWYEANNNRSGEWGYGIHHFYGNQSINGDIYYYNYDFRQNSQKKQNLTYKLNQTINYKTFTFNGSYNHVDVDERINSSGQARTINKSVALTHSKESLPLSTSYSENHNFLNELKTNSFNFQKEFLHQKVSLLFNKTNYTSTNRYKSTSKFVHNIQLPLNIKINQSLDFTENYDNSIYNSTEQTLKYVSILSTKLPYNVAMTVNFDYLLDVDEDRVTTDIKQGINNHLYKLPEIKLSHKHRFFQKSKLASFSSNSVITLGSYQEVRYFENDPYYMYPAEINSISPNVYQFNHSISKTITSLPASSKLSLSSTYDQYIFKNEGKSLFEGDAQYNLNYKISLDSTFFKFIKHSTSYARSYGHKNNNSPFYSFQKSLSEQNRITEKVTFFYTKKRTDRLPFTFNFNWDHSTAYNWLLSETPFSSYKSRINVIVNKNYRGSIQTSKDLNKRWKKENNLFTPLIINLSAKTKNNFKTNYNIQFNMNDLVFENNYIVKSSDINFEFPLGKNKDFQWKFKGYFKYIDPNTSFRLNGYQFQTFSIIKDEHERQIEIGYNKTLKELVFKFHFKLFSDDPLIVRKTDNVVKFEGRLNQKSKERF